MSTYEQTLRCQVAVPPHHATRRGSAIGVQTGGHQRGAWDFQSNQVVIHPLIGPIHIEIHDQRSWGGPNLANERSGTAAGIKLEYETTTILEKLRPR